LRQGLRDSGNSGLAKKIASEWKGIVKLTLYSWTLYSWAQRRPGRPIAKRDQSVIAEDQSDFGF
jgi:hypothetical protein